jgi:ketol-acid reductoisomerase
VVQAASQVPTSETANHLFCCFAFVQVPGKTLFPIEEAIDRGTIIMNLLSDAAQSQTWDQLKPLIVSFGAFPLRQSYC